MNNSKRGREAQFAGASFENWIEGQHNAAVMLGILAHWFHPQPRFYNERGLWQPAERSVADFVGVLEGEGVGLVLNPARFYVAEAKSVKSGRMPRAIVARQQAEHLEATAHAGGLALLIGEFRLENVRVRFACPWLDVPWEVARSAESITPELMASWDVGMYPDCFLKRWHSGGKRSGSWKAPGHRVYSSE
jgi:hypothetical protein